MAGLTTMKPMNDRLPSIRSYTLRGNRMTTAQAEAITKLSERFCLISDSPITPIELFPNSKEVIVEVGSGMGEATALIAARFPDTGFIAIEVHKPGIGALLIKIAENSISNLKLLEDDATVAIRESFPDRSINAFHIFFPDPWSKVRQRKRRIIQTSFLDTLAIKLKTQGRIHIATDWQDYANYIKRVFLEHAAFEGGIVERPDWRPLTKFEGKGLRKDHNVTDFTYTLKS